MQLAMEVLMVTVTVVAPGCHTKNEQRNGRIANAFFNGKDQMESGKKCHIFLVQTKS